MYSNGKKSYVVSKIDNIDLVEKDIRILDDKGKLSHKGRLEIRKEGVWGTICSFGNNSFSAKRICKDLGYIDGEWGTDKSSMLNGFCSNFNGGNYCGFKMQQIHYYNINCQESDSNFNSCGKVFADTARCNHDYDAIINCFNEDFSVNKNVVDGVIRLENTIKNGKETIGRLEMYIKGEYLPICSKSFNDISAKIACKQMGFKNGKVTPEKFAEKFKIPIESNLDFAASDIRCRGNEIFLKECKSIMLNIVCRHDEDLVISCYGKGDVTGKSQYIKPIINNAPQLGKLGMPKYKIDCETKANFKSFRGDPGSVYLVDCPINCEKSKGSIWGTGIYTTNSSICRAAIHSGVLNSSQGGVITLIKLWGQKYFEESISNGIKSFEHKGNMPVAFSLSKINSGWLNMNSNHLSNVSSFMEEKQEIVNHQFSSFVSINSNEGYIPIPDFNWTPKSKIENLSNLNSILINNSKFKMLSSFTFLSSFTMTEFKGQKEFIFSYLGCNGFNVLIDESGELIIGDYCSDKKVFISNIAIPLNVKITIFIYYSKGNLHLIYISLYSKFERKISNIDLEVNQQGDIGIGIARNIVGNKENFFGKIDFINLYNSFVDPSMIDTLIKSSEASNSLVKIYRTIDNRECITVCSNDPVPGTKGSQDPPKQSQYAENLIVQIPNLIKNNKIFDNENYGTFKKNDERNIESIDIKCSTNLKDPRFKGTYGKIFRVNCPNCFAEKFTVFGSMFYHPLSSICKAASHIGILPDKKGGEVMIEITNGMLIYNGSTGKDGKVSASIGKSDSSFKIKKAKPFKKIECITTAQSVDFALAPILSKFVVSCPKNCSKTKSIVYGTEIYTDNSPICLSAIHYGMISDNGGEVK